MSDLHQKIIEMANPDISVAQLAAAVGCDRSVVYHCIQKYGLNLKQRKRPAQKDSLKTEILSKYQVGMTSAELALMIGCSAKYVQKILNSHNVERLNQGARHGELNPAYKFGRIIDNDGYAHIPAPVDHPYARKSGRIAEHRHVVEQHLGRYLEPHEVVDHIDGLHLHNCPSNLRVFESNAHHLRETISGLVPNWSQEALEKQRLPKHQRITAERIDSYRRRKANGDVRLQQILLAALQLGIDSPFLLGTHHHLEQAQIDYSSLTKIEQALDSLYP